MPAEMEGFPFDTWPRSTKTPLKFVNTEIDIQN